MAVYEEHGFVGNVWVRQNWLILKGDTAGGHAHYHDHVSLLVKGSVEVTVGDICGTDLHCDQKTAPASDRGVRR
jgi:hypothetical protein